MRYVVYLRLIWHWALKRLYGNPLSTFRTSILPVTAVEINAVLQQKTLTYSRIAALVGLNCYKTIIPDC